MNKFRLLFFLEMITIYFMQCTFCLSDYSIANYIMKYTYLKLLSKNWFLTRDFYHIITFFIPSWDGLIFLCHTKIESYRADNYWMLMFIKNIVISHYRAHRERLHFWQYLFSGIRNLEVAIIRTIFLTVLTLTQNLNPSLEPRTYSDLLVIHSQVQHYW